MDFILSELHEFYLSATVYQVKRQNTILVLYSEVIYFQVVGSILDLQQQEPAALGSILVLNQLVLLLLAQVDSHLELQQRHQPVLALTLDQNWERLLPQVALDLDQVQLDEVLLINLENQLLL